ncbi:alpha/beta fold hydrolase [Blastochloris viridis]|uniref:Lysophospholipase n=1 Tax=Blastochloris viridis TaxID=1079 RepID=A0A0H5B7Z2_BLAVI|nr:alpha/beta fold hydrolase [Blastochloris viridis]ALK08422.1 Alpha/beta hydrolase family protein [Blastochloris viridis]BAR98300.1 lysophospholipase [Blastochloris viridis]CUU41084.1 putative dienelactone hydrolase [Blastochloris viridis]
MNAEADGRVEFEPVRYAPKPLPAWFRLLATTLAALLAIAIALWQLVSATSGLEVRHLQLGDTPVTVFRPAAAGPAPAVVIAHGFAGSQQLMQPFAVTLANSGYVAVTFDFAGHGRNPTSLAGGLVDRNARAAKLIPELDKVIDYAKALPGVDGRVALLGHSMASDLVARTAKLRPDIAATVAISLFSPEADATGPRNLLVVVGAVEDPHLMKEAYRAVAVTLGGRPAEADVTYGSFERGTARRVAVAPGVEHIAVLYSPTSLAEARDWLNEVFGRDQTGPIDARGWSFLLLFGGLLALAKPLAGLLPRVSAPRARPALRWAQLFNVALVPAILTPFILWASPVGTLSILVGEYLYMHFAVYGVLTLAGLWLLRRRLGLPAPARLGLSPWRFALALVAVTLYGLFAIGWPVNAYISNMAPVAERVPLIFAMFAGTLVYFIADEWLLRGTRTPRGAYALTKACFLLSLGLAVALNPPRLFFLVITAPVMVAMFVVFGLISRWVFDKTREPLVAAVANAAIFAWAIAATFPIDG